MFYIVWAILTIILLPVFPPAGLISLITLIICSVIKNQRQHFQQKKPIQTPQKMQEIERKIDDIETTLDIITEATRENGKIVPIWSNKPPER